MNRKGKKIMNEMTTKIRRKDYITKESDEVLTHIIGTISSVEILKDNRIRIRILELQSFNNPNLSLVNGRIIDCILPEIKDRKAVAAYQELVNCVGSSLPIYSDDTINLLDLKGCSVVATVKPKYIKKSRRYYTKLKNLVILPSN